MHYKVLRLQKVFMFCLTISYAGQVVAVGNKQRDNRENQNLMFVCAILALADTIVKQDDSEASNQRVSKQEKSAVVVPSAVNSSGVMSRNIRNKRVAPRLKG